MISGNLMMGKRFAFANPAPHHISIDIYVYSDIDRTEVQVSDNSQTETKFILQAGSGKY